MRQTANLDYIFMRLNAVIPQIQRLAMDLRVGQGYGSGRVDGILTGLDDIESALSSVDDPDVRKAVGLIWRARLTLGAIRLSGASGLGGLRPPRRRLRVQGGLGFAPPPLSPFGASSPGAVTSMMPQGVTLRMPGASSSYDLQLRSAGPQAQTALGLVIAVRALVVQMIARARARSLVKQRAVGILSLGGLPSRSRISAYRRI